MAQDFEASVEPTALPGRPYPRFPDSVSPQETGAEIGRGFEEAGAIAHQVYQKQVEQSRQTQLTDAHNQLQALSLDLTHNPQTGAFTKEGKNAFGLTDQYLPAFDKHAEQIVASVADPVARQHAALSVAQVRNHLTEQLQSHEIEQHRQFDLHTNRSSADLAIQTASANYNHPDIIATNRDTLDFSIGKLADAQGWSDEERQEALYLGHVKLNEGVIGNMLADQKVDLAKSYLSVVKGELRPQDVKRFAHDIQDGEITSTANGILSAYRSDTPEGAKQLAALEHSNLTPEQQSKVIQQVERGRTELAAMRRQDPSVRNQLTALDGSIASGDVPPGALGTVESLWRRGAVTDDQRLTLRDQILRAQKKGAAVSDMLDYVRDAYANGKPLDPKDSNEKRAVNLLLAETTMGSPPGSSSYNNAAVEIASRVGVVPEGAVGFARASMVGGDPKTAAAGAQLMASLQRANPRAYAEATDEGTRAMAEVISSSTRAGTDPETAVNLAREAASRSKTDEKFLDTAWNAQRAAGQRWDQIDANLVRRGLSDDPHYTQGGFHLGNTVPQVPTAMAAEFADLSKLYFYHTGGNLQVARQLALNDLKSTWGVSEVNGTRELMKYAPERMFPGLSIDEIRADKAAEGYGAARLVESPETATSGGKIWSLAEPDHFGAWDVVRDERGMPLRYQLPEASRKADTITRELSDAEERARLKASLARQNYAAEHPVAGLSY